MDGLAQPQPRGLINQIRGYGQDLLGRSLSGWAPHWLGGGETPLAAPAVTQPQQLSIPRPQSPRGLGQTIGRQMQQAAPAAGGPMSDPWRIATPQSVMAGLRGRR